MKIECVNTLASILYTDLLEDKMIHYIQYTKQKSLPLTVMVLSMVSIIVSADLGLPPKFRLKRSLVN